MTPPRRLEVAAPFHLEATARLLQRVPANPVHVWDGRRLLRAFGAAPEGPLAVAVWDRGRVDAPDLAWRLVAGRAGAATRRRLELSLRLMLGLDRPPSRVLAEAARERGPLGRLARALRGVRPPRFPSLFETCASVVPFQQVSLQAGAAVLARLVERLGRPVEVALDAGSATLRCFPPPGAVAAAPPDLLRQAGLSAAKAAALQGLARACLDGALDPAGLAAAPAAEALAALRRHRGVGPWSAALILLRGLGRVDVHPPGDVGAARALGGLLADVDAALARFGDERGYLYYLALGSLLVERGLIRPAPR